MEIFKKLSFGNFVTVSYYTLVAVIISLISLIRLDTKSFDGFVSSLASPWTLILFILAVLSVLRMLHCWIANLSSFHHRLSLENNQERVIIKAGLPGCGKSSTGAFDTKFLAIISWAKLRLSYFNLLYEKNKKGYLNKDKQVKFDLIQKAYNFYMANIDDYFPCLYSNMRIRIGKRKSYDLMPGHLLQLDTLPYGAVCYIDEIGKVLNSDLFKHDKDGKVEEMYRLSRHFGFWFVGAEQDYNNVFIGVRRDCSYNEVIQRQKACFKPFWIMFVKNIVDKLIIDRNKDEYLIKVDNELKSEEGNIDLDKLLFDKLRFKPLIKLYHFNNKLYNLFGYRYYKSHLMANTEVGSVNNINSKKGRLKIYYLPSNLTLYYNDTYCCTLYQKLHDDIDLNDEDYDCNVATYDFKNKVSEMLIKHNRKVAVDSDIDTIKKKKIARLEAVDEYKERKKKQSSNSAK